MPVCSLELFGNHQESPSLHPHCLYATLINPLRLPTNVREKYPLRGHVHASSCGLLGPEASLLRPQGFQQPLPPVEGSQQLLGKVPEWTLFPQVKTACKQVLRHTLPPSGHKGHFTLPSSTHLIDLKLFSSQTCARTLTRSLWQRRWRWIRRSFCSAAHRRECLWLR